MDSRELLTVESKATQKGLATNTWSKFLETYSPKQARRALVGCDSVLACVDAPMPSFVVLKKEFGEVKAEAYIKAWLLYLDNLLNLKERMNEAQVDEVAMLVVKEYYYLKVSDLNLIISRVCNGHYGKTYDRLSIVQIMGWFMEYAKERMQAAESRSYDAYMRNKEGADKPFDWGGEFKLFNRRKRK